MNWRRSIIVSLVLITGYVNARAAEEDWVKIVDSATSIYSIKAGSLRVGTNDGGVKVALAIGRITSKTSDEIRAAQWYVTLDHCRMQRGNLVITDVVGNFVSETPFVYKLGTVGAELAEFICTVALDNKPKSNVNRSTV